MIYPLISRITQITDVIPSGRSRPNVILSRSEVVIHAAWRYKNDILFLVCG